MVSNNLTKTEKIMVCASKRGFFYPSAEIYGAKAGFWTYGHLGTLLKRNWENLWRSYFLGLNKNFFEIDDCNILPKKVFEASGHLENFNDPLTECAKCHFRFRADDLIEDALGTNVEGLSAESMTKLIQDNELVCPKCQSKLLPVKWFNMMFEVKVGATGDDVMYLRPESAQSPYLAFKREYEALRKKIPMGLAVIGKAFRNEISPRHAFFRLREFTQAELQIFFDPDNINEAEDWESVKDYKLRLYTINDRANETVTEISCEQANKKLKLPKFYVYHLAKVQQFYLSVLNLPEEKFRFRELSEAERAFYNKIHFDIELNLDNLKGFKEVGGVHYRSDHDLSAHQECSKEKLEVVTPDKRFIPHVLELSFGVDRNIFALMDLLFKEESERDLIQFPPSLAPIQVAVFPLVNKDKLPEKANTVYETLKTDFQTFYDASGSIGRRYRRQDEIGTPYCVTVDHETLENDTVTLRHRDSMKQVRVKTLELNKTIKKLLNKEIDFEKV